MALVNWHEILGWSEETELEMRYTGFLYLRQGKYEESLLFFKSLLLLHPQSAYDAQTIGAIYLLMNRKEEALEALNSALTLDSHHEPTLLNKAKTLFLLGQREEAIRISKPLTQSSDRFLADDAQALLLAYL